MCLEISFSHFLHNNRGRKLTEVIQNAPSSDAIHAALRHARSAISVARGLAVVGNDHQYLKTKIYPSNKLAEKQQRFFSTKRKRNLQKKKPVISQSTIEELNKVDPEACALSALRKMALAMMEALLTGWSAVTAVWVHTLCDYVEDKANYVCCMCRS